MDAFCQYRTWERARRLGLCQLACAERHTITNLICAGGHQDDDWSADYRLFARAAWNPNDLFAPVVGGVLDLLPDQAPLVVALDDTRLPKSGKKIFGVSYGRDPMSPPFHVNLVPGQRFVQLSAMAPEGPAPSSARGVPVRFHHQPPVKKPKKSADDETKKAYRQACRENNLSTCGRDQIRQLREEMDLRHQATDRVLLASGDGSYTNKTVLRGLPDRTKFIGRIRKDAQLHHLPEADPPGKRGRKRVYGAKAPTPEELRKDESIPWLHIEACASGRTHTFKVREIKPVLWRKAGADLPLRLVVIAPTGYRLRKGGRMLYRQPAFLISTDLDMPIQELLQYYLWRWDIEVNHRDEKQLIGVGQAQVWSKQSVDRQPAFAVASYAYLLLAAMRVYGIHERRPNLPIPKWQKEEDTPGRVSTQKLLRKLRSEVSTYAVDRSEWDFVDFVNGPDKDTKPKKFDIPMKPDAILARTG